MKYGAPPGNSKHNCSPSFFKALLRPTPIESDIFACYLRLRRVAALSTPPIRPHLPPLAMARMVSNALAVVTVAAATTVAGAAPAPIDGGVDMASTERLVASLRDAVVFTPASDCVGACQDHVAAALTARGCTAVEMLPTLRVVNTVFPEVSEAAADGGLAGIAGVIEADVNELVEADVGVSGNREGDRTFG